MAEVKERAAELLASRTPAQRQALLAGRARLEEEEEARWACLGQKETSGTVMAGKQLQMKDCGSPQGLPPHAAPLNRHAHARPPHPPRSAAAAAAAGRKGEVCAVLQKRAHPPNRVEALMGQPGAFRVLEEG